MIGLNEIVGISDQVKVIINNQPIDILLSIIVFFAAIGLAMIIRYNKFVKTYFYNYRTVKPFSPTPYDTFNLETLQRIVDKLSRNFTILITIYGFLFVFIISQNFQHVSYSWPVIIWSGWVLAIIVRSANIALVLTDTLERAQVNGTIRIAASMIYAYNRYYKHATYLLVFAVAFSPAVFLPLNEQHRADTELWGSQISIPIIALGIIGVSLAAYYFAEVRDLIKPTGIPNIYFMSIFLLAIEPLSYISATPLSKMNVILLGYQFAIPQLLWVVLFAGWWYLSAAIGIMITVGSNYRKAQREKKETDQLFK
ncbi:MAG: hypothetical protein HY222_06240 [Thaumarchaeota archaeon]|nr:hypothetical protein [Nitrososphaerota archaeon]MBI3641976.1 hypothetical protein [Nitrososphaerota archaeon]